MNIPGRDTREGQSARNQELFRAQVLRNPPQLSAPGQISPPVAARVLAWMSLTACLALLVLLWTGRYSARQRVEGYLSGVESVLAVDAGRAGRITRILVRPGQTVREHQDLFAISGEQFTSEGDSLVLSQILSLKNRQQSLAERRRLSQAAWLAQRQSLQASARGIGRQRDTLARQLELQRGLISQRARDLQRATDLLAQGHIARAAVDGAIAQKLDAELILQGLLQHGEELANQHAQSLSQLESGRLKEAVEQIGFNETELELRAELRDLQARRETVAQAPRAGIVGDIQASVGNAVTVGQNVLTLYSGREPVVAELAVPTRLMPVLSRSLGIRIEIEDSLDSGIASLQASILEVSATPMAAGNVLGPMLLRQAAYRVRVAISAHSLKSVRRGLLLPNRHITALLIGPPRPLLHWILQPLRELGAAVN